MHRLDVEHRSTFKFSKNVRFGRTIATKSMSQTLQVPFASGSNACSLRRYPHMKTRFVISLVAASVLLGTAHLYSAETNSAAAMPAEPVIGNSPPAPGSPATAINLLVARIKAKLEMGKEDESDYADILKDFDSLL